MDHSGSSPVSSDHITAWYCSTY